MVLSCTFIFLVSARDPELIVEVKGETTVSEDEIFTCYKLFVHSLRSKSILRLWRGRRAVS